MNYRNHENHECSRGDTRGFAAYSAVAGRFWRVSRHLAALPAVITPTQIYSGVTKLVALKCVGDDLTLKHNRVRVWYPPFRPPVMWYYRRFFIEFHDRLYLIRICNMWLFRAFRYKILVAFTEYNPLCQFYSRQEPTAQKSRATLSNWLKAAPPPTFAPLVS